MKHSVGILIIRANANLKIYKKEIQSSKSKSTLWRTHCCRKSNFQDNLIRSIKIIETTKRYEDERTNESRGMSMNAGTSVEHFIEYTCENWYLPPPRKIPSRDICVPVAAPSLPLSSLRFKSLRERVRFPFGLRILNKRETDKYLTRRQERELLVNRSIYSFTLPILPPPPPPPFLFFSFRAVYPNKSRDSRRDLASKFLYPLATSHSPRLTEIFRSPSEERRRSRDSTNRPTFELRRHATESKHLNSVGKVVGKRLVVELACVSMNFSELWRENERFRGSI